jgi:hypothetical protein
VGHDNDGRVGSQRLTAAELAWEGALAGLGGREAAARLARRLDGLVPWADVLREARRLRLAPLLHLGLRSVDELRAQVPDPVGEALRRTTRAAAARAARLERVCAGTAAAAASAGIPVLVLKGPALGSLTYPAAAVRPMDDVDLLVAARHRGPMAEVLRGRGYRNDLRGEEDFLAGDRSHGIDLHTEAVNTTRLPARRALWPVSFDELWARSQTFALAGTTLRTLGPQDTLRHLAIHAVHHHGLAGRLWMVDLLACLRAWPRALDGIASAPAPVRRSLWYCLEVLATGGRDPAPEVRRAIRPPALLPGEARLLAAGSRGDLPEGVRYGFTLVCLPTWRAKAAFLRQLLFPRAGVHTDGFGDAAGSVPGWPDHWGLAARLARGCLRAAFGRRKAIARGPAGLD